MDKILILDFGSQYNQLIARRVREREVYCELCSFDATLDFIKNFAPAGIILSGGPGSVYEKGAPDLDPAVLRLGIPILGICYGMQLISAKLGGELKNGDSREYGGTFIKNLAPESPLFKNISDRTQVWMSHGDYVSKLPEGFRAIAETDTIPFAAIGNDQSKIYAVQFHPEVLHTAEGSKIISNFLFEICRVKAEWKMENYINSAVENLKNEIKDKKAILGLSGGVDSSVAAALLARAIGKNLTAIFIDNGLLRKNEKEEVQNNFKNMANLVVVDAKEEFLSLLKGVSDPEKKRKIIGAAFIKIFEREAAKIEGVDFLAQGTIYPDVIESSINKKGASATIKSHHNVGGLPKNMKLKLVEPLRNLFKDEVRELGLKLGLPEKLIKRHPFPGPGLAVRILGKITAEKRDILKEADHIFIEEIEKEGLYDKISQAFVVLLPVKTVGVMGDRRTYEYVAALRAVKTDDFMTADWFEFEPNFLKKVSSRIINEVQQINRVVYDVSSKPPATIEWE